jgi:tetratricopeptide (TPR) repeat protein
MHFLNLLLAALFVVSTACQSPTMTAAKLYLKQEEPLKAKEQLLLTIEAEPENAEARFLLGKLYGAEGSYEEMVAQFEAASGSAFQAEIDVLRQNYWARAYNEGVAFAQGDSVNLDRSRAAFVRATRIDADRLEAWRNLAYVYYQSDQTEEAIATYRHITDQASDDVDSFYSLGVLLLNENRYVEAVDVLKQLTEIDENHLEGHINLAVAQVNTDDLQGAEQSYKQAIAIAPDAANPRYNLGNLYWQQERYEEALAAYVKSVELDPSDNDALYNLAITHIALNDADSALPLFEQLSVRMPNNASVWRELGRMYAINGQIEQSKEAYAREQALTE